SRNLPSCTICKKCLADSCCFFLFIFFLNGNMTFYKTFSQGNKAASWNTTPLSGLGFVIFSSPKKREPDVGLFNPAIIDNKVDLPHPEGPSKETNCPSGMVN